MQQLIFIITTAVLAYAEAPKERDPWVVYSQICEEVVIPGLNPLASDASKWELTAVETKRKLEAFPAEGCSYLESANGDANMRTYLATLADTEAAVVSFSAGADRIATFLKEKGLEQEKQIREASFGQLSFASLDCGKAFANRAKHVRNKITEIETLSKAIVGRCPALQDKLYGRAKVHADPTGGEASLAGFEKKRNRAPASTISGEILPDPVLNKKK